MKASSRWFIVVWFLLLATIAIGVARGAALLDLNGAKVIVMTEDELAEIAALVRKKDAEIAAARAERKKECGLI